MSPTHMKALLWNAGPTYVPPHSPSTTMVKVITEVLTINTFSEDDKIEELKIRK